MPNTYTLLETITVGAATASSVTFNNIPQTGYTDLVIHTSVRGTSGSNNIFINFNGSGGTAYSDKELFGTGSSVGAQSNTSSAYIYGINNQSTYTASTFASGTYYITNYTSSNYKPVSYDGVQESNTTGVYSYLLAGLWSNTAAITSATLQPNSGSFAQYSTFSLYGVSALGTTPTKAPKATGGSIIQTDGTYWYHAFLASGTFTPATTLSCDVLVVAGGGGAQGGSSYAAGGAGGVAYYSSQLLGTSGQTVTVGAGGAGISSGVLAATSGSNSVFGSLTAAVGGGGAGGGWTGSANGAAALSGGSGGGAGAAYSAGGATTQNLGAAGTAGQGFAGGNGSPLTGTVSQLAGGGGGGAGAVGSAGSSGGIGGNGGAGTNTYSSWLSTTGLGVSGYIAGGGAAFGQSGSGTPGAGNGGSSSPSAPVAPTANTGGGGNGANSVSGTAGASGVVIVRYLA